MTKKVKRATTMFVGISVYLQCRRCGDSIGPVWRNAGQHPLAGQVNVTPSAGELVERPDGGWTLHSTCRRCGHTPKTQWERITGALDGLRHDGNAETTLVV